MKYEFAGKLQIGVTVWKIQVFTVNQILREIKIGESVVSKSAISSHHIDNTYLNFDFLLIFALLEG